MGSHLHLHLQQHQFQLCYCCRVVSLLSDELYRVLLVMVFLTKTIAITFFLPSPFGTILGFVHMCWLYAFYAFEYKWGSMRWSFTEKISYFECRWAYFLGFGFLAALATFFSALFTSAGIFAVIFPIVSGVCFAKENYHNHNII